MNLLLLRERDLLSPGQALVRDPRQREHLLRILKVAPGSRVKFGLLCEGQPDDRATMGHAEVQAIEPDGIHLQLSLDSPPPPPLPLTLILALPRPQQIKRILQTLGACGVDELHLIHSRRVEKSYWQSPSVTPEAVREQLLLGLEQGCDTHLPNVYRHPRFRPFAEDRLPSLTEDALALLAHPYTETPCPAQVGRKTVLAVGPEGGFNDFEVDAFTRAGFAPVHLGPRILKTEIAIPYLLGRLF